MVRRLCFPLLAAAAVALALGPPAANASIRVTISDGGVDPDQTFVSASDNFASFTTTIGGVEFFLQTTTSNFPGTTTGGNLLQTININDTSAVGGGTLPNFTVKADLVDGSGNLLKFTAPSTGPLNVSSDISSSEPIFQSLLGTVQNHTIVTAGTTTTVDSLLLPINGTVEGEQIAPAPNTSNGYSITSIVDIRGLNVGTAISISASSAVVPPPSNAGLVPEPISVTVWGLGALGLGFVAARRSRRMTKRAA